MQNLTKNIEFFWQWFENQYDSFIKQHCYLRKPAYELQEKLEAIHPDICFQIAHRMDLLNYELIFSCGHNLELKDIVKNIAELAPDFPLLKVSAFKQRTDQCEGICLEHISVHVNDIYFTLKPLLTKIGIHIYTKHNIQEEEIQVAIILLLENLLGEELMLDHVADIQFHPLHTKTPALQKLVEISTAFDYLLEKVQSAWHQN